MLQLMFSIGENREDLGKADVFVSLLPDFEMGEKLPLVYNDRHNPLVAVLKAILLMLAHLQDASLTIN